MFENSVLFAAIKNDKNELSIVRIVQDASTQNEVAGTFSDFSHQLISDTDFIEFDGKYTPDLENNEVLKISNFNLPEVVKDSIKNPMGLDVYEPIDNELPLIKFIFVGCHNKDESGKDVYNAAFQKFKNDQYITPKKHNLFFSKNTFITDKRLGIQISNTVDCLFYNGNLIFKSYHFTRQIFDLSKYYREATKKEIEDFVTNSLVTMEKSDSFIEMSNSWERKKIASINDSGVLGKFSPHKIQTIAKKQGVTVKIGNGKVIIPSNKKERRIFLGFLDEEVYKGAFSNITYQTNSKRKA